MSDAGGSKGGIGNALKDQIFGFNPFGGLDPHDGGSFLHWIGEWGVSRGFTLCVIFFGLLSMLWVQIPNLPLFTGGWLLGTAPIWVPVALWMGAWKAWINYVRSYFLSNRKPVLLEVKLPKEIYKSPLAMETVFSNLYANSGETGFVVRLLGSVFPYFSFELASFGGDIHFYAWCWGNYRSLVEASIYSQYPEVEIVEVEDYASKFKFDPDIHSAFCGDYIYFGRGFPGDEYPIKSYVDFELDKDPKEEYKVDPFAETLEVLSNLKPHEQVWIQMYFRFASYTGILLRHSTSKDWKDRVIREVEHIRTESAIFGPDAPALTLEQERVARPRPTWRQTEQMRAMERHLGKQPFEIGMRHAYISSGELHGPTFTAIRWIYKPLNSPLYFNFFRSRRAHNDFDYPWQDFRDYRWNLVTRRYIDMMRRRSFFYTPWTTTPQVMSTEMMATLYHYPSSAIKAPGITRIPSKKAEPPPNLPR